MEATDVAIIGAGPAGIAAAIQISRYNVRPALFEQEEPGGLLRNAHLVENYPGFPTGISGPELASLMKQQIEYHDLPVRHERVLALDYEAGRFLIRATAGELSCRFAVVASGTVPKRIPGLAIPEDAADQVFYEVLAIRECESRNIVVIGAGDAAFDYALGLAERNKVGLLSRSATVRCTPRLMERALSSRNISLRTGIEVAGVEVEKAAGRNGRLLLCCRQSGGPPMDKIAADYLLIAVGREPATHFLTGAVSGRSAQLISAGELYMIGDVANGAIRQVSISVGNGVEAAMRIAGYLGVRND